MIQGFKLCTCGTFLFNISWNNYSCTSFEDPLLGFKLSCLYWRVCIGLQLKKKKVWEPEQLNENLNEPKWEKKKRKKNDHNLFATQNTGLSINRNHCLSSDLMLFEMRALKSICGFGVILSKNKIKMCGLSCYYKVFDKVVIQTLAKL